MTERLLQVPSTCTATLPLFLPWASYFYKMEMGGNGRKWEEMATVSTAGQLRARIDDLLVKMGEIDPRDDVDEYETLTKIISVLSRSLLTTMNTPVAPRPRRRGYPRMTAAAWSNLCDLVSQGATVTHAASLLGISESTVYRYREASTARVEELERARMHDQAEVELTLTRAARQNWRAALVVLERRGVPGWARPAKVDRAPHDPARKSLSVHTRNGNFDQLTEDDRATLDELARRVYT